jgi:hypothetical protein
VADIELEVENIRTAIGQAEAMGAAEVISVELVEGVTPGANVRARVRASIFS